jgi:hypothetical protein
VGVWSAGMARWAMAAAAGLKPMRGEDRGGSLAVPCGFGNVGFITFDQLSVPGEKGSLHTDRVVPKRPPQRVSCADSSVLLRRGQAVNAGRVHGPEVGAQPGAGAMARQSLDDCAASMTQAMLSSRATRRRRADSGSGATAAEFAAALEGHLLGACTAGRSRARCVSAPGAVEPAHAIAVVSWKRKGARFDRGRFRR